MRRQAEESSVILGCYLLAFLVFFFTSIFTFPALPLDAHGVIDAQAAVDAPGLLARFQWPFIWSNSLILFMRYCLPVTVAAAALAHSVGGPAAAGFRRGAVAFGRLVAGNLAFLIGLAVLYSFVSLGLEPLVERNVQQMHAMSREAAAYLRAAQDAESRGERSRALEEYERYLEIDPDSEEIAVRRRALEIGLQEAASASRKVAAQEREQAAAASERRRYEVLSEGRQAHELMDLAGGFENQGDLISAHYYYSLAARIDPARADARRKAALAWQRLEEGDASADDQEQRELYQKTREAYALFDSGRYLAAYYAFQALQERSARSARSPQLATWLERSRRMVVQETFFLDEARRIDPLPGPEQLLFRNGRRDGLTEIVLIGKMARVEEGTFFRDIEVLRYPTGGGAALLHYTADYGKLMEGAVNLHGVQRRGAGGESLPRYLVGRPSPAEPPHTLALAPPADALPTLTLQATQAAGVGLLELWQMHSSVAEFGHSQLAVSAELLRRLQRPFGFLVLSLAAVAFGWAYRRRRLAGPAWAAYLFVPVFALVALFFTSVYLHAQRVLVNFLLLELGFGVCLVTFLALQGVLLFVVLLLLAGQPSD